MRTRIGSTVAVVLAVTGIAAGIATPVAQALKTRITVVTTHTSAAPHILGRISK